MPVRCRSKSIVVALAIAVGASGTAHAVIDSGVQPGPRLRVLVIHGPNLNLLGRREPQIYGTTTLDQINARLGELAKEINVDLIAMQSNSEGAIVDAFQKHMDGVDGALINGAGLTFSSVSIHDAIKASNLPAVEVHLTNVYKREPFRHKSFVSEVAVGVICGFGSHGYELALEALSRIVSQTSKN